MRILRNTFHNKTYELTTAQAARFDELDQESFLDWTDADKKFAKRIRDRLCGVDGCICSGAFGIHR